MANRTFNSWHKSLHFYPVNLDCNIAIGASGAVGTTKGPGIKAVTRLATGVYQIQFQDNYYLHYLMEWKMAAPVTGASVTDGSFVIGTPYIITAVGTTNWASAGLATGLTAAVGQGFVATSIGGAGTGTAKAVGTSGIYAIEHIGDPSLMVNPAASAGGGYELIKCLNAAGAATDPASGSVMYLGFVLSNSSVTVQGE